MDTCGTFLTSTGLSPAGGGAELELESTPMLVTGILPIEQSQSQPQWRLFISPLGGLARGTPPPRLSPFPSQSPCPQKHPLSRRASMCIHRFFLISIGIEEISAKSKDISRHLDSRENMRVAAVKHGLPLSAIRQSLPRWRPRGNIRRSRCADPGTESKVNMVAKQHCDRY